MKVLIMAMIFASAQFHLVDDDLVHLYKSKYNQLIQHLLKKIDKKLRKLEKRKDALKDFHPKLPLSPPPFLIPPPFAAPSLDDAPFGAPRSPMGLHLPPFPFLHFVKNRKNLHLFRPHPQFKIFKRIETVQKLNDGKGSGFIDETNEYPGKDGSIIVEHIHRDLNKPEPKEEEHEDTPIEEEKHSEEAKEPIFSILDALNLKKKLEQEK